MGITIGTYILVLDNGYHLDLLETLYVPLISRNFIFVSKLDCSRFNVKFRFGSFGLLNARIVGSSVLIDGLYK